jgi:hypothetical protein
VPAAFTWLGTDPDHPMDAQFPLNWNGPGGPGTGVPGQLDDALFDGRASNIDCINFQGDYHLVQVYNFYSGTVTLDGPVSTQRFVMNSGLATVDQPETETGETTDITVTGPDPAGTNTHSFEWYAGTINSTDHLAAVNLAGDGTNPMTGLIAPINAGTVKLGSSIIQTGGSVLTMKAGTVQVTNNDQVFEVNDGCGAEVDPGTEDDFEISASGACSGLLAYSKPGGYWRVLSGRWVQYGSFLNEGEFTLRSGVKADLRDPGTTLPKSFVQQGAVSNTRLEYGSELTVQKGMQILGGKLFTAVGATTADVAYIRGNLTVSGGDIYIGYGSDFENHPHCYGTLYVDGNVTWSGGTYRPVIQPEVEGTSDLWWANGTFTVGPDAVLAPGSVDGEGYVAPPAAPDLRWVILRANGGIVMGNNTPPQTQGDWWVLETGPGNPTTEWRVKSR